MKQQQTETFKQPFLGRVEAALDKAVSITWEGCHKIYICLDQDSHYQQIEYGYEMTMVTDKATALNTLYDWWDCSCSLRFISTITDNSLFHDVIAQFEYDDHEEDE